MNDTPRSYVSRPAPAITMQLDLSQTINSTLAAHPETLAVFAAYRLDTCCGGGRSLYNAAREVGIEPLVLMEELERAVSESMSPSVAGA